MMEALQQVNEADLTEADLTTVEVLGQIYNEIDKWITSVDPARGPSSIFPEDWEPRHGLDALKSNILEIIKFNIDKAQNNLDQYIDK